MLEGYRVELGPVGPPVNPSNLLQPYSTYWQVAVLVINHCLTWISSLLFTGSLGSLNRCSVMSYNFNFARVKCARFSLTKLRRNWCNDTCDHGQHHDEAVHSIFQMDSCRLRYAFWMVMCNYIGYPFCVV